jgi:hypothetical protein
MGAHTALARQETLDVQAFIAFLTEKPNAHDGEKQRSAGSLPSVRGRDSYSVHYIDCRSQVKLHATLCLSFAPLGPPNRPIMQALGR